MSGSNGGSIVLAKDTSGAIGIWNDVALQSGDETLATFEKITATIVPNKILVELVRDPAPSPWCLDGNTAQRVKLRFFRDGGALDWESKWVDVPLAAVPSDRPLRIEVYVPSSLEDSVQAELAWDKEGWKKCK